MENKLPCDRHEEQIKTLFKKDESVENRIEKLENEKDFIYSLDKNMAIQTQVLKEISEHNRRQDVRMDKQDKRLDEQHEVIVSINENLTELTEGQRTLNNRVGKLEDKVDENENIHMVDTRKIEKKKYEDILYKFVVPAGIISIVVLEIIKYFK